MARSGLAVACLVLLAASHAHCYSFVSCTNWVQSVNQCLGFTRKYGQYVPGLSHAYNLQADLPAGANQQAVSVDPLLQNRTVAGTAFAAYNGGYPMASAVPGQQLTLTWPRTADPDGDPVTSPNATVYYWPFDSMNAGLSFNTSVDPSLAQFQSYPLATLPFNDNGACAVISDPTNPASPAKYNPALHCNGTITVPKNLSTGIYTFLWYWIIDQPQLYRLYPQVFEVLVQNPPGVTLTANSSALATKAASP